MQAEVEEYHRIRAGELPVIHSFSDIGRLLIAIRIWKGWSQKQLADALGVSAAQVCRDERNEYFGIAVDRVQKILDVFAEPITIELRSTPLTTSSYAVSAGRP